MKNRLIKLVDRILSILKRSYVIYVSWSIFLFSLGLIIFLFSNLIDSAVLQSIGVSFTLTILGFPIYKVIQYKDKKTFYEGFKNDLEDGDYDDLRSKLIDKFETILDKFA